MRAPASRRDRITTTALRRLAGLLAIVGWAAASSAAGLEPTLISIGTGGKTGVYYLAGGAICDLVDDHRWEHGVRCLALSSDGSVDNLRAIRSGERPFGIVQSDLHHHAVRGTGVFEDAGPDRELRSVFALFSEPFTVVARPDAGIAGLADLKGKRVSLGPAGSGGRATMSVVMDEMGWTDADFAYVSDLAMSALPGALCGAEIDAAVFIVAHPNLTLEDVMTSCDATLVPVEGPGIDRLVAENPYYSTFEIPAGAYPGQSTPVPTFALAATLVTSSRTSPAVVREVTKAVFENFDAFRDFHPAFAGLDKSRMVTEGLTAPFHEGALRYFEEAGLR
jgi:TRAP transporter TAXI family solute receptor